MTTDYDSILLATDSNVINRTEFYRHGVALPDHTVAMAERPYVVGEDDCMVGVMALMFVVLAVILHRSHRVALYHLKDFFSTKRQYSEEQVNENANESVNVFLLIAISVLSLTFIYFDDRAELYSYSSVFGAPYWLFAAGLLSGLVLIYLKAGVYSLVNWVFFEPELSRKWQSGYFLLTSLTAFLFYPIALVDVFSDSSHAVVLSSVVLVGVAYEILLFYKLFVNFKTKKCGYLLIFLYFCSVELLPALVLWNVTGWLSDSIVIKNLLY